MDADRDFMLEAVAEARRGLAEGEVPIGAVAVRGGAVVARGRNRRIALGDITAHAEMVCLRDLSSRAGLEFDLADVTVYSTLEPCAMCAGAMVHYRVGRCVWGERDLLLGAAGSTLDVLGSGGVQSTGGVLRAECRAPLLEFFEEQIGRPSFQWEDIRLPEV
ncbi:MAG: nucleoside deaminase [Planctomycetota bacterium]|jgi:tRNA(adenine34) deaminase